MSDQDFTCRNCGKHPEKPFGKFCSIACRNKYGKGGWESCAVCLGKAGLGSGSVATILRINPGTVWKAWKKLGFSRDEGRGRSLKREANSAISADQRCINEAQKEWIAQIKRDQKSFPDWSSIWTQEKFRRDCISRYHGLSAQEKKARNRRSWENRKSDPLKLARQRQSIKKWTTKKRITDPGFRVQSAMRCRLSAVLRKIKSGKGKTRHFTRLVGCTSGELATYLEKKFKRGMTWENYGTEWHVDHIMPVSKFDHRNPGQVKTCWHYTNLQPLWAKDNLAKSDSITQPQLSLAI